MDRTICAKERSRRACPSSRVGGPVGLARARHGGVGFCGFVEEPDRLTLHVNLWPGDAPGPPNDIPRATQRTAARHGPSPEARGRTQDHAGRPNGEPERARPGLGRRCRTARRPGGRATDPPAPRIGARHPSGTDCWLGVTPQRLGGWGCPAPSPLAPIEVCRDGGSLPATSKERRLASALRWPWCNRKRTSDMDGRGRVRPNGDSVSGDPQSEPDTQDSPPTPAFGAQNGSPDNTSPGTARNCTRRAIAGQPHVPAGAPRRS